MESNFNNLPIPFQKQIQKGLEQINQNSSIIEDFKDLTFFIDNKEMIFRAKSVESGADKKYVFDFLFE